MPLNEGYGVLIGKISDYYRDNPDNYGKYYHGNLMISAPAGTYRCAIDVDSKLSAIGVEWRTISLTDTKLTGVLSHGLGYHALASDPTSGAIDYIRSPIFAARSSFLMTLFTLIKNRFRITGSWKRGEGIDALKELEPLIEVTRSRGLLALIYGEPFNTGSGMHNIHQNQGDPAGSQWWDENGVWQDGCTILQQSSHKFGVFMNKFTSQSYKTDDDGHPI